MINSISKAALLYSILTLPAPIPDEERKLT